MRTAIRALRKYLPCILMAHFSVLNGQETDTLRPSRFTITTSLIGYFPSIRFFTGNFNVGTGVNFGSGYELYVNVGAIRPYGPAPGFPFFEGRETHGYRIELEGKRFVGRHKIVEPAILLFWPHIFQYKTRVLDNTGYYMAVHTHYQFTNTEREESVLDRIDPQPAPREHFVTNYYHVERHVAAVHIKVGYQCVKKSGLTIDYGVGLGMQFISSSSLNRVGGIHANNDLDWGGKLFDSGTSMFASVVYQVRLGWAFGGK